MYFNETLNQANSRNEFHTIGALKDVTMHDKGFPWLTYTAHYVWRPITGYGGRSLVSHRHGNSQQNPWYHNECDWMWLGNTRHFGS